MSEVLPDKMLRMPSVEEITGLCASHIYKMMAKGDFPQSIPLTPYGQRARGWLQSEVYAWLSKMAANRSRPARKPAKASTLSQ
jgi:prophage regulatory protein